MESKLLYDLSVSIVCYKNNISELKNVVHSVLDSQNVNLILYLVDNSPTNALRDIFVDNRIVYIFNNANIGFSIRKIVEGTNDDYVGQVMLSNKLDITSEKTKGTLFIEMEGLFAGPKSWGREEFEKRLKSFMV